MTKINLVIASLLKPVDDTRMYEKIGITLADTGKYSVHIVGYETLRPVIYPDIYFFPLFKFNRISIKRILAPAKFYKLLLKVKPKVIIIETPELLTVTIIYKILFGCKIYYDVLENYYYNILYISNYSGFIKYFLAAIVRLIEFCTAPFIDKFFLAEKSYIKELPFIQKKFAVIENKYQPIHHFLDKPKKKEIFHLLYTGTIAQEFGIYAAIDLVVSLHTIDPRFNLTLAGYCAHEEELNKLTSLISKYPFVNLIGGYYRVPHVIIMDLVQQADVGLLLYTPNKATSGKTPTKLFEYIYHDLPILMAPNTQWEAFCFLYNAAVVFDRNKVDPYYLLTVLKSFSFYLGAMNSKEELVWDRYLLLSTLT
jgi:glycosyltransferase involved in cell wall biosynthesis